MDRAPWANHNLQDIPDVPGRAECGPQGGMAGCGSPRSHPPRRFSDGDDEGEWAWPCRPAIVHHRVMLALFLSLIGALRSALRTQANLALENLALRQQLANLRRTSGRPHLRMADRAFWIGLSRLWSRWSDVLVVVKPDTVVRWHRAGFRLFWRWKSRSRSPAAGDVSAEVKTLIRQMAEANVGWGAPRIHGELLKLGIDIGERSVSRFMPPRPRKPPSQTWRTFLDNHVGSLASIDFFTVPPPPSASSMLCSSSPTTRGGFFISISPSFRARGGPASRSSRRSPKTPRPGT